MTVTIYKDFTDYYQNGIYADCPQEHRKGGSFGVSMLEADQAAGTYVDPAFPQLAFVEVVEAPGTCVLDFATGRRRLDAADFGGLIGPQPANVECHFDMDSDHKVRALYIDLSVFADIIDRAGFRGDPLDGMYAGFFSKPGARSAFHALWTRMNDGDPAVSLAIDGAFLTFLSLYLPDRSNALTPGWTPALEDARMKRAIDYIDAHLDQQLLMDELASTAALSVPHFARVFRETFGMTAHAYVTRQRIERAKRHLRETRAPVTSIAFACGFGSSSHFATVFRTHVGVSPSRYRSSLE